MTDSCLLCQSPAKRAYVKDGAVFCRCNCEKCGTYGAAEQTFEVFFSGEVIPDSWKLSAAARRASDQGSELVLTSEFIRDILASPPAWRELSDGVDRLMLILASRGRRFFDPVRFSPAEDFAVLRCSQSMAGDALEAAEQLGLIDQVTGTSCRVRLGGWHRIASLRRTQPRSRRAFVAMAFADDLKQVYDDGIALGIRDTAYYEPHRVDSDEHNDRIDDRIIADIRQSGLLVADFTDHRQGVYFEAGFALGLGIPVIFTCRKDQLGAAHFDTRQYSHIDWETPEELRVRLVQRILATAMPRNLLR